MTSTIEYDIVSADSHVLEPRGLFEPRVAVKFRERVPKLAPWNGGDAWHIEGLDPVPLPITAATGSGYRLGRGSSKTPMAFHDVLPGLYEPVSRLEAQAANSIDAEVLYPSPTLWDAINQMDDRKLKVACVRAYNDWIAEFCAQDPRRLIGLGKIPSTGGEDACKELHRCVEELNLRGVVLDGWPSGKQIAGDSDDDVFWEAIDGLGVPVSLHYAVGGQRPSHPYGGIGPGLKPPMADAALPLVAGSVFDRFPNIRLVFAHGDAGWVFHWLEFMDINYVRHRHLDQYALQNPDALPSEYVRKHSWFTFHHDRSAVKNRQKVGAAHLMWASHFPLDDSNWPDDRRQAMRVTEELPSQERSALLAGNTARLYRLPGYEQGFEDTELDTFEQLVYF